MPATHSFKPLDQVLAGLDDAMGIDPIIQKKALLLRDGLLATTEHAILLHGDLHHGNVLNKGSGWCCIDPKGCIGDRVFEVTAYMVNPIPMLLDISDPMTIVAKRAAWFASNLAMPIDRIWGWLYVRAAICWVWNDQAHLDTTYWQKLCALLDAKALIPKSNFA